MFTIYGGKTEFQQWDLGQLVANEWMKAGDEVVFRNAHGETYVVKAFEQDGAILADVPNYLLMKDGNILVDLEQGNEYHTDCRTTFNVIAREKPEGYNCECNIPNREANNNGGGSGGSGGGAEKFVVNFETLDMQNWTCDKTLAEIIDAHTQGRDVVGSLMGQMMVDFIEVSPNGKVTFGRVFHDRTILLSYYILVADDGVEVVCASCQMTKM